MTKKNLIGKDMWCYFAPDGYPQLRSITFTKRDTRYYISKFENTTWMDYEKKGFVLGKVNVNIIPTES